MAIVLNADQQTVNLTGGDYIISTFLNGGTASLEMQQTGSTNWASVGTLTAEPQVISIAFDSTIRLTKTGGALVELSR